jgi:hypothetical protein
MGNDKNFLERLRMADEKTKRKIMVIAACICTAIVIYVWIGCFNNLVSSAVQVASADIPTASVPRATLTRFWDGAKNNAGIFYQKILGAFADVFQGSRQYNVQPQQ